jgi:hypothetical protein
MFFLILLGLIMLALVIYLAVSKQSSFVIRIAALAALGLMMLSVIMCLCMIFLGIGKAEPAGPVLPFMEPPPETPTTPGDMLVLVGFVLFMIALFAVVLAISLREHRRNNAA